MKLVPLALAATLVDCQYLGLSQGRDALANTHWELAEITLTSGESLPAGEATLSFDAEGNVGSTSCNWCHGVYRAEGRSLSVERLACTRRACIPEILEIGPYLEGATRFSREGEVLVIHFENVQGESGSARFVARAAPQSEGDR